MTRLSVVTGPSGSLIELSFQDGRFFTRRLEPDDEISVTEEVARFWYGTAQREGGCLCAPFPSRAQIHA